MGLSQNDEFNELMDRVPSDATRVYVLDTKGKLRYKDVDKVTPKDTIQTNQKGDPVVMKGKPGRKKIPTLDPISDEVAELVKRKRGKVETDPILNVMSAKPESADVLYQVVHALGTEAASIEFEREEAERNGDETSQISVRRINALKAIADTWLKRKDQLGSREIDLESPAFRAVFELIAVTLKECMQATGIRAEMVEAVFAKFGKKVDSDEWARDARSRMKNVL